MLCWPLSSVVAHGAVAAGKRVVAVAHIPGQVGRHARRLIRHHLGLGHGVAAHRTARIIWHASVVCVPGASLLAIFGPPATDRVAGWLPTAYPGTGATTGVGGGMLSPDPYTVVMPDHPPINAPEPACVLLFGGAAMLTMVARRFRRGRRYPPRAT
jgi:hypothetical protein